MKEELNFSFWHIFIHFRLTIVVTVYSQFTHKHLHSYLKSESDAEKNSCYFAAVHSTFGKKGKIVQ